MMREPREVVLEREARVWELVSQGWRPMRIAQELAINPVTVSRIKARVSKRLSSRMEEQVKSVRSEQIAQLEFMRDEALLAWERSKGQRRTVTIRRGGENGGGVAGSLGAGHPQGATIQQYDETGDTRYLDVAIRCNSEIRRILGVDAPLKSDVTHHHPDIKRMNDGELTNILISIFEGAPGEVGPGSFGVEIPLPGQAPPLALGQAPGGQGADDDPVG